MSRQPEKTELLTGPERKAYAHRLRQAAMLLDDFGDILGKKTDAWVFRKPSLVDGLRRVDAFTADLKRTINQHIAGKPLNKNSDKTDLIG